MKAILSQLSPIGDMTIGEARAEIEAIRASVDDVRGRLWNLKLRNGWRVLGFKSFRECISAEFPQHLSYLYRQLSAAEIEAEISPNGEIGRIAEGKLRPLAEVPPGERKPTWEKAKAQTGKEEPTGKEVEAVVRQSRPKPKSQTRHVEDRSADFPDEDFNQGDPGDEPANLLADEDDGAVAESPTPAPAPSRKAESSLIEREPGEDGEPEDDEEWLDALPLSRILYDEPWKTFRRDALIYRRFLPIRESFRLAVSAAIGNRRPGGPFGRALERMLKAEHPRDWCKCLPTAMDAGAGCDGLGNVAGIKCTRCYGAGYLLYRPKGGR